MNPTTDDLKTLFDEVSGAPPVVGDLVAAAARRGRTVRRRRVAVAAVCAALVVAGVAVPNLHDRSTSAPPIGNPTPTPTPDDPLTPEYFRGGRRTALVAETNRQGVSLTYTPESTGFGVAASCLSPAAAQEAADATGDARYDEPMAEVLVDGKEVTGGSCQGQVGLSGTGDLSEPTDLGLTPGVPVTVTMRPAAGAAAQLGVTDWQLALYEPVPRSEYPFPEPPETLQQVDSGPISGTGHRVLWGNASEGDGFTYRFPVEHGLELLVQTTQPGELRLYVDDRLVVTQRSWTYTLASEGSAVTLAELGIASGDTVVVRVEADGYAPGTLRYALFDRRP